MNNSLLFVICFALIYQFLKANSLKVTISKPNESDIVLTSFDDFQKLFNQTGKFSVWRNPEFELEALTVYSKMFKDPRLAKYDEYNNLPADEKRVIEEAAREYCGDFLTRVVKSYGYTLTYEV